MMWTRGSSLFLLLTIQFVSSRLIVFDKNKDGDKDELISASNVVDSCYGDEIVSLSNFKLPTLPLIKSRFIKAVNLDNTNLTEIPDSFFDNFPNIECLNVAGSNISLRRYHNIRSLKTLILDNTSDNELINLFNVTFPLLTRLRMTNNRISKFDSELPETLQYLHLENNGLVTFTSSGGNNLRSLYLNHNTPLATIRVQNSPNLALASFRNCALAWVHASTFFDRDRLALRVLDMSSNNFNTIADILYQRAKNLEVLILNNNRFTDLPQLTGLPRLRSLFLRTNSIGSVANLRSYSLTLLSLRDNKIISIAENAFKELPVLETLDLSVNKLEYLPKGWADHLDQLKTLNLTSNRLASLGNTGLTYDFSDLRNLYLEENLIANITHQELDSVPINSTIHMFGTWRHINQTLLNLDP